MTTKLFLDTEFTGLHQNTTLISLALVAETGEEFYAEFTDYDQSQVDPWIQEHVIDHLFVKDHEHTYTGRCTLVLRGTHSMIADRLSTWLKQPPFKQLEIWSDCYAYDLVLFNQLFGGALNLPKNVFYIPFDLATVFQVMGIDPDVNREEFAELKEDDLPQHNSLRDARVQLACYQKCCKLQRVRSPANH